MSENIFWSLKQDIEQELHALSVGLSAITEDDLNENVYFRFSHQLDHVQQLFDRISEVNRELVLTQSNPNLYNLLAAKEAVSSYYGQFNQLRRGFFNHFAKFRHLKEEDFLSKHSQSDEQEPPSEEEGERPPEAETDEDAPDLADDALTAAENRKARQKRLAAEAHKKELQRQEQQLRQEEAAKLGIRPEQPVSEADLHRERILQQEERRREEQQASSRIEQENEVLRKENERQVASAQFVPLENQHIDMSRDGIGHSSNSESSNAQETPVHLHVHEDGISGSGQESASPAPVVTSSPDSLPSQATPESYHTSAPPQPHAPDIPSSFNNSKIYSDLIAHRSGASHEPILVSPEVETQMRLNVERARLARLEAEGTEAAAKATHEYIEQSDAFFMYQAAVYNGTFRVAESKARDVNNEVTSSGPTSFVAREEITQNVQPTPHFANPEGSLPLYRESVEKNQGSVEVSGSTPYFSPEHPFVVSPSYEAAIVREMERATTVLESSSGLNAASSDAMNAQQAQRYVDAYHGFQRAKEAGAVVVSSSVQGDQTPDYVLWQRRHLEQTERTPEPTEKAPVYQQPNPAVFKRDVQAQHDNASHESYALYQDERPVSTSEEPNPSYFEHRGGEDAKQYDASLPSEAPRENPVYTERVFSPEQPVSAETGHPKDAFSPENETLSGSPSAMEHHAPESAAHISQDSHHTDSNAVIYSALETNKSEKDPEPVATSPVIDRQAPPNWDIGKQPVPEAADKRLEHETSNSPGHIPENTVLQPPREPLVVSPSYEAAIVREMERATAVLESSSGPNAGYPDTMSAQQAQRYVDAYHGFQRAKETGIVVVSSSVQGEQAPDYALWQRKHWEQTDRNPESVEKAPAYQQPNPTVFKRDVQAQYDNASHESYALYQDDRPVSTREEPNPSYFEHREGEDAEPHDSSLPPEAPRENPLYAERAFSPVQSVSVEIGHPKDILKPENDVHGGANSIVEHQIPESHPDHSLDQPAYREPFRAREAGLNESQPAPMTYSGMAEPKEPFMVSPSYEAAIVREMERATAVLEASAGPNVSASEMMNVQQAQLYVDAYHGFQRAKEAGTVVVSSSVPGEQAPDYALWQRKHLEQADRNQESVEKASAYQQPNSAVFKRDVQAQHDNTSHEAHSGSPSAMEHQISAPATHISQDSHHTDSNAVIYSALATNKSEKDPEPVATSPAIDQQAPPNWDIGKQPFPEAADKRVEHETPAAINTPNQVGSLSGETPNSPGHIPENVVLQPPREPLVVSPSYEAAIVREMERATAVLEASAGPNVSSPDAMSAQQAQLYVDAYHGFQRAKEAGTVVVSSSVQSEQSPDFTLWQRKHLEQTERTPEPTEKAPAYQQPNPAVFKRDVQAQRDITSHDVHTLPQEEIPSPTREEPNPSYFAYREGEREFRSTQHDTALPPEVPRENPVHTEQVFPPEEPVRAEFGHPKDTFSPENDAHNGSPSVMEHQTPERTSVSPQEPLMVSPSYEAAIVREMERATAVLESSSGPNVPSPDAMSAQQAQLYVDAYHGFQRAKETGTVVVSSSVQSEQSPDFTLWQRKHLEQTERTPEPTEKAPAYQQPNPAVFKRDVQAQHDNTSHEAYSGFPSAMEQQTPEHYPEPSFDQSAYREPFRAAETGLNESQPVLAKESGTPEPAAHIPQDSHHTDSNAVIYSALATNKSEKDPESVATSPVIDRQAPPNWDIGKQPAPEAEDKRVEHETPAAINTSNQAGSLSGETPNSPGHIPENAVLQPPREPLMVSPSYEAAIVREMERATAVLEASAGPNVSSPDAMNAQQAQLYVDAYHGFQRAKEEGAVVVSSSAQGEQVPDYALWQRKHLEQADRTPEPTEKAPVYQQPNPAVFKRDVQTHRDITSQEAHILPHEDIPVSSKEEPSSSHFEQRRGDQWVGTKQYDTSSPEAVQQEGQKEGREPVRGEPLFSAGQVINEGTEQPKDTFSSKNDTPIGSPSVMEHQTPDRHFDSSLDQPAYQEPFRAAEAGLNESQPVPVKEPGVPEPTTNIPHASNQTESNAESYSAVATNQPEKEPEAVVEPPAIDRQKQPNWELRKHAPLEAEGAKTFGENSINLPAEDIRQEQETLAPHEDSTSVKPSSGELFNTPGHVPVTKAHPSPTNPLIVTPAYEAAIIHEMERAVSSSGFPSDPHATEGTTNHPSQLYLDAYQGFQQAVEEGSVIVSHSGDGASIPDYSIWQKKYLEKQSPQTEVATGIPSSLASHEQGSVHEEGFPPAGREGVFSHPGRNNPQAPAPLNFSSGETNKGLDEKPGASEPNVISSNSQESHATEQMEQPFTKEGMPHHQWYTRTATQGSQLPPEPGMSDANQSGGLRMPGPDFRETPAEKPAGFKESPGHIEQSKQTPVSPQASKTLSQEPSERNPLEKPQVVSNPEPIEKVLGEQTAKELYHSDSNARIYSALMTNRPEPEQEPIIVSPIMERQMRANLERSRAAYLEIIGTDKAPAAAQQFQQERESFAKYQIAVKQGFIHVDPKAVVPNASQDAHPQKAAEGKPSNPKSSTANLTPDGKPIPEGRKGESAVPAPEKPVPPQSFRYSKDNPLVVSPAYEEAITKQMWSSTAAMTSAIAAGDVEASVVQRLVLKLHTDAYLGFQHGKEDGSVLVSPTCTDDKKPDFSLWQQKHMLHGNKEISSLVEPGIKSSAKGEEHQPDRSGSLQKPFVPYQLTPTGIVPAPDLPLTTGTPVIGSNAKIYAALMGKHSSAEGPVPVSPLVEAQMRFNVEQARLASIKAEGTDAAPKAVHAYLEQRNILSRYHDSVKQGIFRVAEQPGPAPAGKSVQDVKGAAKGASVVYALTPTGTVGQTIENGQATGNRYTFNNPGLRARTAYSPDNPMIVSASYEEAITSKMESARAALDASLALGDTKAAVLNPIQAKLFTDAYLGFQRAKQDGTVIVSPEGKGQVLPDFSLWQQRYLALAGRKIAPQKGAVGVTGQSVGANPNHTSKKDVEETVANIFNKGGRLKQQSVASLYAKQIGQRVQHYSYSALLQFSQKMYRIAQSGDDNALKTLETGRYYITTAAGVVLVIQSGPPIKALRKHLDHTSSREFRHFGTKSLLSGTQVSAKVNDSARRIRELTEKLSVVEKNMAPYISKMEAYLRANPSGNKLDGLDKHSRVKFQKLSAEMKKLRSDLSEANKTHGLHQKIKNSRFEAKLEKELLDDLKTNGKLPKSPKAIQKAIQRINEKASAEMTKKYGALAKVTDQSLKEQLDLLKQQGKDLKAQIKLLESKGAALSAGERKLLKQLKADVKDIGVKNRKLFQLSKDRAALALKNKKLDDVIKAAYKNKGRITNSLFALQGFMLRALQTGYESNTDGLARVIQISTNRYVHILVKKAYKASLFLAKHGMNMIVPGSGDAAAMAINIGKAAIKTQVGVAKNTIKTAVNTGIKASANLAKQTISKAVPGGIKTAVKEGAAAAAKAAEAAKKKVDIAKAAADKAKKWLADSRLGRAASAISRGGSEAMQAVKAALTALKGVVLKICIAFGAVFGVVGILTMMIAFSASGSVIGAPYKSMDGKIDLAPYVKVIIEEEAETQNRIKELMESSKYDKVTVNYTGVASNIKEMLSMMAVRMEQELDLEKNVEVEGYLRSLYHDSHKFSTKTKEYKCDGCKERSVSVSEVDPETGLHVVRQEKEIYCPGHTDLTVTISLLSFDDIFIADSSIYDDVDLLGSVTTEKVWNYLKQHGLSDIQAAGIMGNIEQESRFFTTSTNEGSGAFGLCQWLGGRKERLQKYAESKGEKVTDLQIQLDYFWMEFYPGCATQYGRFQWISSQYPFEDFMSAETIEETTKLFCFGWERPGNDGSIGARISAAKSYYDLYANKDKDDSKEPSGDSEDTDKKDDSEDFAWTKENIKWAKLIYNGDWNELYTGLYDYGADLEVGEAIVHGDFYWPIHGNTKISSAFGWRIHPIHQTKQFHKGVDIPAETGTPIHAAADGVVIAAGYYGAAGNMVTIEHENGVETSYLHCSQLLVTTGEKVKADQVIALVGSTGTSTGPHLDFRFFVNGTAIDPCVQYGLKSK